MISIVIPVYNSEETIERCIDSIFRNSFTKPYEIVCVNDGSKDKSLVLLKKLQNEKPNVCVFKLINLEQNAGVQNARNVGLENSVGDYIAFVDSDDEVSNSFLSVLDEEIEKNKSDIFCFNGVVIDGDNRFDLLENSVINNLKKFGHLKEALLFGENGYLCNHLYKKDLLSSRLLTGLQKLTFTEDLNINIEIALKKEINFQFLDDKLYFYYFTRNTHIDRLNTKRVEDAMFVINKRYEIVKSDYPDLLEIFKTGNLKATLRLLHNVKSTKNFSRSKKRLILKKIKSQESIKYTLKLGFKRFMKLSLKDKIRYVLYK